jgi:hypothetical protein
MRSLLLSFVVLLIITASCRKTYKEHTEIMDLSGTWKFQLDSAKVGIQEKWFYTALNDSLKLPGTTDENKKGIFLDEKTVDRLSRVWFWKGAAWYQKEVTIPENWVGKNVKLLLERTKDTNVWFDDNYCGYENTLSAPQYFNLTKEINPGKHRITVLVNNAILPPVGDSFAISEKTQTNWNGIIGKIELQATDPVWIEEVQSYPDVKNNQVRIRIDIKNITGEEVSGNLQVFASSSNTNNPVKFKKQWEKIAGIRKNKTVEIVYTFNKRAPLWDEFEPTLIQLNLILSARVGNKKYNSSQQVEFGMREFKREGKYLTNNGKRVFLRGRVDRANYPLTGYAPMDKDTWLKLFRLLKSYGINHWRFHSWFPPRAALMAADETGIYLQPELPNQKYEMNSKNYIDDDFREIYDFEYLDVDTGQINMTLKDYLRREGKLILKYFGNHPSFTMFTLGNELGRNQDMFDLVATFKEIDSRRLYAQGSNNETLNPSFAEGDDFWVSARSSPIYGIRGSFATHLVPVEKPHIEYFPPSTLHNYTKALENHNAPMISHEVGQYQVSPDFSDIPKFTGVTRAGNLEEFKERFAQANLLDQADNFVKASGKLAVICYREDIEAALRTPEMTGFQLLDIQDYPGQGTALVGILNDFMESKGLIAPEEWSQFCCEVVPLLKMKKYTWINSEIFSGAIDIAHYGEKNFTNVEVEWEVVRGDGETFAKGIITPTVITSGRLNPIGEISFPLNSIKEAEKLQIIITLKGTKYQNKYDLWIYPEFVNTSIPEGIIVSASLDARTKKYLEDGGKAIIIPDHKKLTHCINGAFHNDFWCYPMFKRGALRRGMEPAPGSLGFICDPSSPLFEHFPTEFHSNWQWWHLVKNCKPIILDETPADYKPLIQNIDNFARNHKLGMIFETKYGKGSALICAIDLLNLQDKPEARQLYYSMLGYVNSDKFYPAKEISREVLSKIIP